MRMFGHASVTRSLVALGALFVTTAVYAQAQNAGRNLNIFAVNLDNKKVYSVTFTPPGGSTTVGNTDENNYVRPEALAFVTNATTFQLDLLIADNQRGTLYRYPGALAPQTPPNPTTATLLWNAQAAGTGPAAPDALAVDGYGNLFVANSTSGHSQSAQLWMFPVGASGSGSFGNPVLLDSGFQSKETLVEVALVPTDIANGPAGVSGGDLILLTSSRVLTYSQSSGYTVRTTLLTFPNGCPVPGGMDFWPIGNGTANYSLLVTSSSSPVVNRYYFGNPLTAAPAPFYTGAGTFYRIKTLFQQGNPLLFLSKTGSIVELGANPSGNGTVLATVTQNVTTPQGLAVSNSFTNAASVCLQPGGCNLTGLLTHTLTGISTLTGNIVENVCTVNADPRVSIVGGVWSCGIPYTPPAGFSCPPGTSNCLPVNAFCPGFDDTGQMVLPDTLCGKSGSSGAGFSLIKTLVTANQFAGGYVSNSAVLADGTNPICGAGAAADGALIWAPLQAEGTIFESPDMVDITSGCGSGHGKTSGVSIFGVGIVINEAAPELNPPGGLLHPLENFAQTKYTDLTITVDNLTETDPSHPRWTDTNPNILASVSLELWGGNVPPASNVDPFGCLDQSWLDFYNATRVDTDGSPQWTADLQNAANLLANADATGNTTCDGVVAFAQANVSNAFVQTPSELNPYGQLRSRLANLYYTINTRLLGNAVSTNWPLPISINVVPTSVTLASSSSSGSATLSFNTNGDSSCTLTSNENPPLNAALVGTNGNQPLTLPHGDAGNIVQYTVTCGTGPAANSVYAYVNVYPPPTLSVSQSPILQGGAATLSWNTNHAQGCTGNSNDPNATAFNKPSVGATGSLSLNPAGPGNYTYTLACATPSTSVQATLMVLAPPILTFASSVVTPITAVQGSGTTLSWNTNNNSACTLSGTDGLSTTLNAASGATTVNTTANPAATGPVTYTYTLACAGPPVTPPQQLTLTVVPQPTLQISTARVLQGSSATLNWNTYANSPCSLSSSPPDTSLTTATPLPAIGSATVTPTSAQTFTYTLACPAPTTAVPVTLTVNAPQPPSISVSPSSIVQGNSSLLSWTINTGDVCTGSSSGTDTNAADAFTGMKGVSGSMTVTPNATGVDTYSLNCTVPAVTQSAALTVTPQLAKISISIKPVYDLDIGDPGILSWSLSGGATGCQVSGSWPKYSVPQFSPFPVASSGSKQVKWKTAGVYTYTLSCTNPSAPVQTSVTITNDK